MLIEQSKDWRLPPWEVTGENLTRWRRIVWQARYEVYQSAFNERMNRMKNNG